MHCRFHRQITATGFTLIEILVTIVVIGIAAVAVMGVFTSTVSNSANPLIQQQAIAIAEAYIEEIQLKQFCNDAPPPMTAPPPQTLPGCPSETGGAEAGETRSTYNDVQDYADVSVDGVIRDQNGTAIFGLGAYSVTVDITTAALGSITDALRIDVSVNHPAIDPIILSTFRTNY